MSDEDYEWLEAAMKEYTYDEASKMKEIAEQMKKEVLCGFDPEQGAYKDDKLYEMLEELQSMIETHERNSLNFCLL